MIRVDRNDTNVGIISMEYDHQNNGMYSWNTRKYEHRINLEMIDGINHALDEVLDMDPPVSSLVFTGKGKFFCNGLDLLYINTIEHETNAQIQFQRSFERLLDRILTFPLYTIAAINGHACAGGAMLALAFDHRIIVKNPKLLMFVPAVDLGLVYSKGMTLLMKERIPKHVLTQFLFLSKRFSVTELKRLVIVQDVVNENLNLVEYSCVVASKLCADKFSTQFKRDTLHRVKCITYEEIHTTLQNDNNMIEMGFTHGLWNSKGIAIKSML